MLAHARYKELIKSVKSAVEQDRNTWLAEDLDTGSSTRKAWAKARLLLGQVKTSSPKVIKTESGLVTDPVKLSELFVNHYSDKYTNLRAHCTMVPTKDPVDRVRDWLTSRGVSPPSYLKACV